ncbi:MAG: redox-sensing transcriptional repressor Rex [Oscillospiraceae bacterium]|jgi:redox-sensing transcriptional repressor
MKKASISNAVIRRMPRYYRHVNELIESGADRISSSSLSKRLGLTASQIRQDFSCFGEFGQQGYGYNLETLRSEISAILGANLSHTAILIGVGNLGRALLQNFNFTGCGFKVLAAFDIQPTLIGTEINGIPILSGHTVNDFMRENRPDIAILTVQKEAAPSIARRLVDDGIKGIWNFTNVDLHIEDSDTKVENVHFADSLLTLSYYISQNDRE